MKEITAYLTTLHGIGDETALAELWNAYHEEKWNYDTCKEWCKVNSVNHRF